MAKKPWLNISLAAVATLTLTASRTSRAAQNEGAQGATPQTSTSAQEKGDYNTVQLLRLMDKDSNGKVSRAEFDKFMNQQFDRLDIDKDGELDANELAALHWNYLSTQLLPLMDKDRNGKVSRTEFMKFMDQEFDRLDVNKDGQLDVTELAEVHLHYLRGYSK